MAERPSLGTLFKQQLESWKRHNRDSQARLMLERDRLKGELDKVERELALIEATTTTDEKDATAKAYEILGKELGLATAKVKKSKGSKQLPAPDLNWLKDLCKKPRTIKEIQAEATADGKSAGLALKLLTKNLGAFTEGEGAKPKNKKGRVPATYTTK